MRELTVLELLGTVSRREQPLTSLCPVWETSSPPWQIDPPEKTPEVDPKTLLHYNPTLNSQHLFLNETYQYKCLFQFTFFVPINIFCNVTSTYMRCICVRILLVSVNCMLLITIDCFYISSSLPRLGLDQTTEKCFGWKQQNHHDCCPLPG